MFLGILDETSDRLRQVFGTANRRTLPLSATGSAGMEAAFVNTVGPGDVVVVAVNGLFGQRMVDVASRCGAEVVAVEHEWGQPVDADRVLAAHPAPKLIAAVHAETSTGVLSDLEPLAAGQGRRAAARRLRDLAGRRPGRLDDWGVDLGLLRLAEVPGRRAGPGAVHHQRPGVGAADREAAELVPRPRAARRLRGGGGRLAGAPTTTPRPTGMVVSLHAGLGRILEEGLDAVHARHAEAGRLLHEGLQAMGLELFAAEGHRLPELTTVRVPDGVDSAAVRKELLERYDIEIGGGVGRVRGHRLADRPDGRRTPRPTRRCWCWPP